MRVLLLLLWVAGLVQVAIASANLFLPAKLKYRENLSRVSPVIRQIFVVHSVYIVGVLLLFAAVTFGFPGELASGHGLGRFLAAARQSPLVACGGEGARVAGRRRSPINAARTPRTNSAAVNGFCTNGRPLSIPNLNAADSSV